MKRLISVLLMLILLCGCATDKKASEKEIIKGDPCDFLTNAKWEGNDSQCVNVITFKQDGGFSNWCYCGSPVGNADVAEEYCYHASNRSISIIDCDGKVFETGKILYADSAYLIIDLWTRTYVYENLNAYRPKAHIDALEYTGTEDLTKPFLTVLDYNNDILTVSSYNYDKDAASDYETWQLEANSNITFTSVSVTVENEVATVKTHTLNEEDIKNIGEFYTGGYFEIDRDGSVASIVFYGELIIQN